MERWVRWPMRDCACASVLRMTLLPPPVCPISMTACRICSTCTRHQLREGLHGRQREMRGWTAAGQHHHPSVPSCPLTAQVCGCRSARRPPAGASTSCSSSLPSHGRRRKAPRARQAALRQLADAREELHVARYQLRGSSPTRGSRRAPRTSSYSRSSQTRASRRAGRGPAQAAAGAPAPARRQAAAAAAHRAGPWPAPAPARHRADPQLIARNAQLLPRVGKLQLELLAASAHGLRLLSRAGELPLQPLAAPARGPRLLPRVTALTLS